MIEASSHVYSDGVTEFEGWFASDTGRTEALPGVMIVHAFGGLSDFEKRQAERLAEIGYAAFAVDLYGKGRRASTREEAAALMAELNNDRPTLAARMNLSLQEFRDMPQVDAARTAAIGFCFGGKAVLDLARSGTEFSGGVVFHGVYDAPAQTADKMNAPLLILHGWDDPLANPDQTVALAAELTERCPDWQLLAFGHTGHAFTNPNASQPGMMFSADAERRSWNAMSGFLQEKLSA